MLLLTVVAASNSVEDGAGPRVRRSVVVISACAVLVVVGLLLSLIFGSVTLPFVDVWRAVIAPSSADDTASQIVRNLRLPRALVAVFVGLNLAVAGVLLQGVMRNPLAAPNVVGITAGGGLAATIVLVMAPGMPQALAPAAFVGATIAGLIVYGISYTPGVGTSPIRMVLGGVAVTAVLGAVTTFLMVTYSDRVQSVVAWMSGSLAGRSWGHLYTVLPYSVAGLIGAALLARRMDILQLGDDSAASLGVPVERTRFFGLIVACLLAGSAISVAGLIAFIGLVVPHILRMLVGVRHAMLIPAAALGGAALCVFADLVARTAMAPREIPAGVLTALIGGPYFVFLLYKTRMLR
ncbi:MAG: iron ABC transporter permease [Phycisphaerales bacterium]|nr:iron ABC transporter permease [Phycisphaerales bacterium]